MEEKNYISEEGLNKLMKELEHMKGHDRKEISLQIEEAREKGDLSENAEYHAAKDAQGLLELKIKNLESAISSSRVVNRSDIDTSKVSPLCKVDLEKVDDGARMSFHLVSESEADLKTGKISVSSPIGKGLLGKKVGEVAIIEIPAGVIKYKILSISL